MGAVFRGTAVPEDAVKPCGSRPDTVSMGRTTRTLPGMRPIPARRRGAAGASPDQAFAGWLGQHGQPRIAPCQLPPSTALPTVWNGTELRLARGVLKA